MAEISTLARPYARAAFEAAKASERLDEWSAALATLGAVTQQDKLIELIGSPSLTPSDKAAALSEVCGEEVAVASELISVLAENRRLELLSEVSRQFESLKAEMQQSVEVQVITPYKLTKAQEKKLVTKLKSKLGREVIVVPSVDKSIIGGAVIRTDDMVIDGSVAGKLKKLAEAMYS